MSFHLAIPTRPIVAQWLARCETCCNECYCNSYDEGHGAPDYIAGLAILEDAEVEKKEHDFAESDLEDVKCFSDPERLHHS